MHETMCQHGCSICKTGDMTEGCTTVMLERNGTTIVIKEVPAEICDDCGEYYPSEAIAGRTLGVAENAANRGVEVEILRWTG